MLLDHTMSVLHQCVSAVNGALGQAMDQLAAESSARQEAERRATRAAEAKQSAEVMLQEERARSQQTKRL